MSAVDLKEAWNRVVKPPQGWQGDLYFYNRLGQKIRYGFSPAQGETKGTVVLTHGYAEHIDLYYETIKRYQDKGYDVWAMDWQGHGQSERDDPADPLKPSARGMLRHTRDLDFFVNNLVKTRHDPDKPLIMNTHSMGGHIGLLYLKKYPGVFDGAVMSAPMFDIYRLGMGSWARPLIRLIFNTASALGLRNTHVPEMPKFLSFIGNAVKRLSDIFNGPSSFRGELHDLMKELNPDKALGRPTFGWIANAFKTILPSMKKDFLQSIKTPTLIGSADFEDLVANDAHERAAKLMPNGENVKIKNAHHGLWFEEDGPYEDWWKHVEKFIEGLDPVNPHERDADSHVADIIAGKDAARSLRGLDIKERRNPSKKACDLRKSCLPEDPDDGHNGPNGPAPV